MTLNSFANRTVLITGAAGGFGSLLAEELASAGARLCLSDYDSSGLEAVVDALRSRGAQVFGVVSDVSKELQVRQMVERCVTEFGRLDIAVNNAGLSAPMKALVDTTEADLDRNFAVNAKGVFFGMKYQIVQMLAQGGGIILNVASKAGLGGAPKLAAYCAAKHAVVGLSRTAAIEYAAKGIRVNAICPYYSPTPLVTEGIDPATREMLARGTPMKRLGEPGEIVQAMLALIAPENSYLNGQALAVDGGASAF
ncbi:SDR family NAD(P)-dependent oxidoreductase [Haliea sp. E17]|uniref:SDR family NAD(P)-dependent oxidoreductase n=1 Tax=Haliea sp. E17 TaxID=3401576 RepID=UPI003AAAAB2F